jgi:hypothetical protein
MPLRARLVSVLAMWGGISVSFRLRPDAPQWWTIALVGAGLVGTAFVCCWRRGSRALPV